MSGSLNLYNLGSLGVNVDKNAVQLEDGELSKAQNAIHDPTGSMGGIRKRPGLLKVNSGAVSGSVFGICNVPISPITTRRFLIGVDQDTTTAYQWITSTDAFGSTSTTTTPAACSRPAGALAFFGSDVLTNRGTQSDGLFIYPGDYTRGNPQPIRVYDGTVDREWFQIPLNAEALSDNGAASYALRTGGIPAMLLVYPKLYIATIDFVQPGGALHYSRVMEYDIESGVLQQVGQACSGWTGNVGAGNSGGATGGNDLYFTSLAYHQGYLYAGVSPRSGGASSAEGGVYRIRPGVDIVWTYDYDNSATGEEQPMCMASYKGLLYVGMVDQNTATSHVRVRSAAGAYSSSTSMGSAVGSGWTDMKVFGDNLYACAFDNNGASSITTIRKFDGSSWSTVKTISTGTNIPFVGVSMIVHNGVLYVLAINTTQDATVLWSSDGTTWSSTTSNLTNDNLVSIFGVLTD